MKSTTNNSTFEIKRTTFFVCNTTPNQYSPIALPIYRNLISLLINGVVVNEFTHRRSFEKQTTNEIEHSKVVSIRIFADGKHLVECVANEKIALRHGKRGTHIEHIILK